MSISNHLIEGMLPHFSHIIAIEKVKSSVIPECTITTYLHVLTVCTITVRAILEIIKQIIACHNVNQVYLK
jgi:hypothetical protein